MASVREPSPVVLATAGYDHTIKFWDATSGTCQRSLQFADSQVNALAISRDKEYLAAAGNPHVRMYSVRSKQKNPVTSFDGHTGNVTAVGFQKDRRWMFTGGEDGSVKIWDVRAPGVQRNYQSKVPLTSVVLHPNQGELISADQDGTIRVWDLTSNRCSYERSPGSNVSIRSLSIAADATMLVAANDKGHCFAWNIDKTIGEEPAHRFEAHNSYILKCKLSPNARLLATCSSDCTVKIWNVEKNFALERQLVSHQRWVWDCAFSADSAYLVTASSDRSAKLWGLDNGEVILNYAGQHRNAIICVALNDTSD